MFVLRAHVHLHRVEDGLQHGENIAEEEVPSVGQRVQQLLTWFTSHGREATVA